MNKYSQNDIQWKSIKHGTSSSNIGATGCTITALAMMLQSIGYEENPKTVNQKLTDNGGYSNGNLLLWESINKIWPRAKWTWRGWSYTDDDNAKIASAIKNYGSCLVEVNGAPIGGTKHWVIYIGNQKMIDPWDGLEKPTSSYSAIGYSLIELMKNDDEEIPVSKKIYEMLVGKATKYDKFVELGFDNPEAFKQKLDDNNKTIINLNQTITDKNGTIATQQGEISSAEAQLISVNEQLNIAIEQAKKVPSLVSEVEHLTEEKSMYLKDVISYNKTISQLQTSNNELKSKAVSVLIRVVFDKFINFIKEKIHIN